MSAMASEALIAVVVGNTSTRIGYFEGTGGKIVPAAQFDVRLDSHAPDFRAMAARLPDRATSWYVASVYREAEGRLHRWVGTHRPDETYRRLRPADFPLQIDVDEPDRVGTDRLAGAVAANVLRCNDHGAIVVDVGTAISIDALSPSGAFQGGAILPGLKMSATVLDRKTDLLPHVDIGPPDEAPPPIGKSTSAAIRSGLFWGTTGAIHYVVQKLTESLGTTTDLFLTGGGINHILREMGDQARFVPDLVLTGICLTAERLQQEPT